MKTLPIFVFIVWSGVTSLGAAQIYLVSGSQNTKVPEKFATELISVSESGAVSSEVEIVSKDAGTWFVEPIYEGRKLVVMSESPYSKLSVVDFDTAKVVKRCIQPPSPTGYGGGFLEWVANVPSVGPAFVQALGSDKGEDVIRRMSIDPSVSCESSFAIITAADARSVIFNGRAGIADIGANDLPSFRMDARGSIATLLSGQLIYPGYVIPENLRTGIEQPWFTLLINNPQMMVASITSRSPAGTYRVVAFRKTDGAWLKIPQVGGAWGIVRGFGSYVAMTETRARGSEYESAGRSLWRKGRSARCGRAIFCRSARIAA